MMSSGIAPARRMSRVTVKVAQKQVERAHALLEAGLEPAPFLPGEQPGQDVERDQPLGTFLLAIDGEGDADAAEQKFRLRVARLQDRAGHGREPFRQAAVDVARHSVHAVHFVEELYVAHST